MLNNQKYNNKNMKALSLVLVIALTATIALDGLTVFHNISPNVANAQIQSSSNSIDWAIGGYSEATGYSQYQFQWIPSDINSSSINYGGVLLNVPVEATGTMPDGSQTIEVWIQAVVTITNTGEYYPSFQVWAFSPTYITGISPIAWTSIQISPNGQIAFMQLNYTTYDGYTGWWYILGLGTGTLPTTVYYLAVITPSGNIYAFINGYIIKGTLVGVTSIGNVGAGIDVNGNYFYPSIGLEINESNYGDFTNSAFVVYGSFFAGNNYLNNVYYANSSSSSADNGFMAGATYPPSTMAGSGGTFYPPTGATEYAHSFDTPNGIRSFTQFEVYTQMPGTDLAILNTILAGNFVHSALVPLETSLVHVINFSSISTESSAKLEGNDGVINSGTTILVKYIHHVIIINNWKVVSPWYIAYPYSVPIIVTVAAISTVLLVRYAKKRH
ncbi:MAG: hypothetical protein JRM84_01245 [Nitrososphaerota archaeon]|jgi:hypothetical protein|nr:hypothetical protein [Nitrososphaerota archaeon]MDG6932056.1 hypothetical protein [Nitrososphaerota archaeon]MDG6943634.1 hypothetical protein [Nitrososphaerota archaeon]